MKWSDIHDIAYELSEAYPNVDPLTVRFTDLWQWIQNLPSFDDNPERSNERTLEAIQQAWIDEKQ